MILKVENTLNGNIVEVNGSYFNSHMDMFALGELNGLNINQKMNWQHLIIERIG